MVIGLHLLLLGLLASTSLRSPPTQDLVRLDLRLVEEVPVPRAESAKPKAPPKREAQPRELAPLAPPAPPSPILTAAAEAGESTVPFSVPPQPKSAAPAAAPPAPTPPPVALIPARFDADYLHNPAPTYPRAALRYGDQGRVVLKVLVSAQGTARAVQLEASSGHPRLDQAAVETVRQWRFVPARRGAEPIDDWVLVPVVFRLDS